MILHLFLASKQKMKPSTHMKVNETDNKCKS